MNEIWKLFEAIDEVAYVADVEDYRLIYMNRHLREALGYYDDSYVGAMCYKVLQGYDEPCPFCTNAKLKEGEFLSWVHQNPLLKKRLLIKDTLLPADNGRRCRFEIAIDADAQHGKDATLLYARNEVILNECLQQILSCVDPKESIEKTLTFIGKIFDCDRTYIFENRSDTIIDNTYEWCSPRAVPQKDVLQDIPMNSVKAWYDLFENGEVNVIRDLEDIREKYPETYTILKPQNITSLVAGPIRIDGEIVGFLGVDNPDRKMLPMIEPLLNVIGYVISNLLSQEKMLRRLNELSYHDQLTGVFNRNALQEYYREMPGKTVGVIYCDITGLKSVNDSMGHEAGDRMIRHCCDLLREAVGTDKIFRSGGDEFIVLCQDCREEVFNATVSRLKRAIQEDEFRMALGYVWSDKQPLRLEELVVQADQVMYVDKREYYQHFSWQNGVERRHPVMEMRPVPERDSAFQHFLRNTYCDVEALFNSMSEDNASSYFYFGDMRQNIFYISNNMRDDFGFQDNIVRELMVFWANRIALPEYREAYWRDIHDMLENKRTVHDMRYRVRDVRGDTLWVRCYGRLIWDEEKTTPLFFSGRVTCQDRNFVEDPVSSLLRENAASSQLKKFRMEKLRTMVIGFSLNGITELNSIKGRTYGDRLLRRVSEMLMEKLADKMSFYRLEGTRCMAIVKPEAVSEGRESLVAQIRSIIRQCYSDMEVTAAKVCSFGLMEFEDGNFEPEDVLQNLVSLLRIARQEGQKDYIDYSEENIRRIRERSNMITQLTQDVEHDMENFRIVIQPMVSTDDERPIGGEVLLRWRFEGENVPPDVFIPLLEQNKSIQTAGRWVFEQAARTCARLRVYDPDFFLTFNVSFYQLSDEGFVDFMRESLSRYHLDGAGLVAELTESSLDEQPRELSDFVSACQEMGISVALDDFGSGYSSMRMFLQYSSSIVKLDRSLVRQAMESAEKANFISSIVVACHQFGKTVCVEGVERREQQELVRDIRCDMVQGYYHYRPMELVDVYQLISRESSSAPEEK